MNRLTFPYIAKQKHPMADGENVALSRQNGMQSPTHEDLKIAVEILGLHAKIKKNTGATGEWKWINENKRAHYLNLLEKGDEREFAFCLANMFRNDASYGLVSIDQELENQILLDLDALFEFNEGSGKIKWLSNYKTCGNPFGYLTSEDTLVMPDAPRHLYFANKIINLLKTAQIPSPVIFEIGGGYGGLCLSLMQNSRFKKMSCVNCDLPETLYLCYYFLKKALPASTKIKWAINELPRADIILLPAQYKNLVKKADLVFNANSLSEMERKTVKEYINLLHRLRPKYFLHQNSNFVLFPNSKRHVEVVAADFGVKKSLYHKVYAAIAPWQGAGGRYREFLYERINH